MLRQQAKHPDLTLTDMYNVLEKLRAADRASTSSTATVRERTGTPLSGTTAAPPSSDLLSPESSALTPKERTIHTHGLISLLKQLHDDLDAAVFDAYNWPQNLTDDQLLEKLVALNHQRAAEEKQGLIKYLRPDFQNPAGTKKQTQPALLDTTPTPKNSKPKTRNSKLAWPKSLPDQTKALRDLLAAAPPAGLTPDQLSVQFTGKNEPDRTARITEILDTLTALNQARRTPDARYTPR